MPKSDKGPLTVDEYVQEITLLQDRLWWGWRGLLERVELTSLQDATRVAYTKWSWISSTRRSSCAFCTYQRSLGQSFNCKGCPVKKPCHRRDKLTAMQIEQLLGDMLFKEEMPF